MRNSHDSGTKGSLNRRFFLGVTGAVAAATIAGGHQFRRQPTEARKRT